MMTRVARADVHSSSRHQINKHAPPAPSPFYVTAPPSRAPASLPPHSVHKSQVGPCCYRPHRKHANHVADQTACTLTSQLASHRRNMVASELARSCHTRWRASHPAHGGPVDTSVHVPATLTVTPPARCRRFYPIRD